MVIALLDPRLFSVVVYTPPPCAHTSQKSLVLIGLIVGKSYFPQNTAFRWNSARRLFLLNPINTKLFGWCGHGGYKQLRLITLDLEVLWPWNLAGMFPTTIRAKGKKIILMTSSYRWWRHHKVLGVPLTSEKVPFTKIAIKFELKKFF